MSVYHLVLRLSSSDAMPLPSPGDSMADGMKNSPHNGPGTPREDMPPVSGAPPGDMSGFNMAPYGPDNPGNPVGAVNVSPSPVPYELTL